MFLLLICLRCNCHICHNSLADTVQMFSVLVATHESEQLEEEASGKRRRTDSPQGSACGDFPCCHVGTIHASAKRLDTLQEVPVPELLTGDDSQNKGGLKIASAA